MWVSHQTMWNINPVTQRFIKYQQYSLPCHSRIWSSSQHHCHQVNERDRRKDFLSSLFQDYYIYIFSDLKFDTMSHNWVPAQRPSWIPSCCLRACWKSPGRVSSSSHDRGRRACVELAAWVERASSVHACEGERGSQIRGERRQLRGSLPL